MVGGRPKIVVENKADLAREQGAGSRKQERNGAVRTSALTGEGIERLRAEILQHVAGDAAGQRESGFLTNVRHQGLVREAIAGLDAGWRALDQNIPHEMMLLDLYTALHALDAITGATTTDDILNLIFSSFCIGK
jgi:tRNA modification GTPase